MFGIGTLDRPWLDPAADVGRPPEDGRRVRVHREARRSLLLLPRSGRRPGGRPFAEFRDNLDALTSDALGHQERTGARLLWGTANLFTHPRYQGGAATNPDPDAYAAAQVKHMLEVTQRLGGTNYVLWGGREGYDTLLNTDLGARATNSPGSFTSSPSTSTGSGSRARCSSSRSRWSRRSISTTTTRRRSTASSFATGSRTSTASTSRPTTRRSPGIRSTTRWRTPWRMGSWFDRRQSRRSAERLGHRPIPELRRRPGPADLRDPPRRRVRDRRLQLRREAAPPEHPPDRPVPGPHRRDRHVGPGAAGRRRAAHEPTLADRVEERYARWSGPLGTAILDGHESLASLEAKVASGRSTRDRCPGTRSCSRTWSTRRSGRRTSPLASSPAPAEPGRAPSRPRDRRVDDRDEGRPDRRGRGGRWRRGVGVRVRNAAAWLG